ncbi:MAG: sensor histidine kinase KdpD [Nitrospinae bacterium]|nr:sensor histidine kinase KdpD [Nitrospinota bacterium]
MTRKHELQSDERPNPDEILKNVQREEKRASRGKLRIFFGMCAGVGKTYAMLEAARNMAAAGVDVAVGVVETHGRKETELMLAGLRAIPQKKMDYKNSVFLELDIERILVERPPLVLVDELAHTNAPGSRHAKRYQDVEEILDSGIDVYSTMNVQHLDSRADPVRKITGINVRETVPDTILELADQIELIDLPPRDLLKRLKEGKVYLGEKAELAAANFFKEENLMALREMALRFTAEKVDDELRGQMTVKRILGPWNTNERLLVAVSQSPHSPSLIRRARRMAFRLGAPWVALYVDSGLVLSETDQKRLHENLELAKELGAELVTTRDTDVAGAVNRVCLEKNVTQIVMGRPERRFFMDIISRGTILEQLIRDTSEIDIHVIRRSGKKRFRGRRFRVPAVKARPKDYALVGGVISAASLLSLFFQPLIGYRAVGYVFMATVLLLSMTTTIGPIFFAATLGALIWDFFFVPPLYTFMVSSPEDLMMISAYFLVAVVAGALTTRIKRQDADLRQREHHANVLYELGRSFSEAKDVDKIVSAAVGCVETLFAVKAAMLMVTPEGQLSRTPTAGGAVDIVEKEYAVAFWSFSNNKKAGWNTDTLQSAKCKALPLLGKVHPVGVLLLYPQSSAPFPLEEENLIDTIASQLAVALERELLDARAKAAQLLEESERLHQTLLNSVSHELRTPITSIIGHASALQDPGVGDNPMIRLTVSEELIDSAERLNRIVGNLLDMSRLSGGILKLKKEVFDVNDLVSATLETLQRPLRFHKLTLGLNAGELYCEGDYRFLEHAIANVILNAAYYSPTETTVDISTGVEGGYAFVRVKDEGKGIPEESLDKIFEKFYRIPGTPPGGTGLGLSIVKNIVEAHNGTVAINNRFDRSGAIFSIMLPLAANVRQMAG